MVNAQQESGTALAAAGKFRSNYSRELANPPGPRPPPKIAARNLDV